MAEAFAGSAGPPTPRRSGIAGTLRPRSQAAPPGAGVFDGPALRPAPAQAVVSHAVVTRLDAIATSTDRRTWERRAQVQRVKRLVAIAAWLAFVAAVILILFIGSRPSPPDFYSWSRTLV